MKINSNGKSERASSLTEVLVASGLLALGAAALMCSFRTSFQMVQLTRENQRATQILIERAETIRLYSWAQVNSNGFIHSTFTNSYDPHGSEGHQGATFFGNMHIEPLVGGPDYQTNMRKLTVELNWQTGTLPRTRTLVTYVAKDGLQNYVY